jgi:transcription elongation factor GreB
MDQPDGRVGHAELRIGDSRLMLADEFPEIGASGPEAAPEGRVGFARWVTVEDEDGVRTTWRIVGPDEVDPRRGLISVDSPVARALLGREAGEVVLVQRPGGAKELSVVDVRRSPP